MHRRDLLRGAAALPIAAFACHSATRGITAPTSSPRVPVPGEPLVLEGRLVDQGTARPLAGFTLDYYQTDADGYYARPDNDPRQARVRGSAITDVDGRYRIDTIVPAPYADRRDAVMHLHHFLAGPDVPIHSIEDTWFHGDPAIDALARAGRALYGIAIAAVRDELGTWRAIRDLRLDRAQAERTRLVDGWYP
jgi:protocatechuate 3,4-dioxygenase beta subunit